MRSISTEVGRLQQEMVLIREQMVANEKSNREQLAKAYERYEAVQRHAMMQVDETRQAAASLRQKLQAVEQDAQIREDAQRGKAQMLREENVRLLARLEILGGASKAARGSSEG